MCILKHFRGRINENFCHCGNFVSEASFAAHCRQNFNIMICTNCIEKMLLWVHFRGIMELLLNNDLGHFLIIEKNFVFLSSWSAIKPTPLLHVKFQMLWSTKCNQSNWQWPKCFYEPESPVTTLTSGQLKLPIRDTGPAGGHASVLGQINLQLMQELGCSKSLTGDCTIMNS